MTITGGSLFSGIGGFELAAEIAGLDVAWAWQVERDAFCREVLAARFPHVSREVSDVLEASADNLVRVDCITGGFPCQDISSAGSRRGLAGEQSGLWAEFARIVREIRPRFVVVENSSALLGRGLGVVLGDLAACGYDAEWDCIPASAVGAHHQRDRVWLVAYLDGERVRLESERCEQRQTERGDDESLHAGSEWTPRANTDGRRRELGRWENGYDDGADARWRDADRHHRARSPSPDADDEGQADKQGGPGEGVRPDARQHPGHWSLDEMPQPELVRVVHGVPERVDRLARRRRRSREIRRVHALGNAVVPQVAAIAMGRVRQLAEAS